MKIEQIAAHLDAAQRATIEFGHAAPHTLKATMFGLSVIGAHQLGQRLTAARAGLADPQRFLEATLPVTPE